jgi:hypothetical protein
VKTTRDTPAFIAHDFSIPSDARGQYLTLDLDLIPHDPDKTGTMEIDRYNLRSRLAPLCHK